MKDTERESNEKLFDYFSPEFLNRIDKIIHFRSLSKESMIMIVNKSLASLSIRLSELGILLEYDHDVCEYIANKTFEKRFGARELIRSVTNEIENKVSSFLLEGELSKIRFCIQNGELVSHSTFKEEDAVKS